MSNLLFFVHVNDEPSCLDALDQGMLRFLMPHVDFKFFVCVRSKFCSGQILLEEINCFSNTECVGVF